MECGVEHPSTTHFFYCLLIDYIHKNSMKIYFTNFECPWVCVTIYKVKKGKTNSWDLSNSTVSLSS